jgi:hypothetical protein
VTDQHGNQTPLELMSFEALRQQEHDVNGLIDGPAQKVVIFSATCDLETGPYVLRLDDRHDDVVVMDIEVGRARYPSILAVPRAGPPGTTFEIYYCGYQESAGREIEVDLYYAEKDESGERSSFVHSKTWIVPINEEGWGREELPSRETDPTLSFLILDRTPELGFVKVSTLELIEPELGSSGEGEEQ